MDPGVDAYIDRSERWSNEIGALCEILRRSGLTEQIKWGKPCYGSDGANIAIVQEMKAFVALMFFKGALLDDPDGILESQGPNSRAAMRMTFRSVADIEASADAIGRYLAAAIAVEAAGLTVEPAPPPELVDELQRRLDGDPALRAAFDALTPGRQREYNLYFSGAKQAGTRAARVEKYAARILAGRGMRDR